MKRRSKSYEHTDKTFKVLNMKDNEDDKTHDVPPPGTTATDKLVPPINSESG